MTTETLPTRVEPTSRERFSNGFQLALGLHGLAFAGLFAAALLSHRSGRHWGDQNPTTGSIQASMVDALPLPPKQRFVDKEVLASDKPNIAPTPPPPEPIPPRAATPVKPKAEPPPKPDEIPLPSKLSPPKPTPKVADRPQPQPVTPRPVTPPPPTPKATTGETAGVQIPQSVTQLKNGTASITVEDRPFGDRYAYYIRQVSQKINQSKSQELDPPDTRGKRAVIHFVIDRDGTPTDAQILTRGGSAALDTSTLRAIQRIDTFGPLPAGNELPVTFIWDSR